MVTAQGRRYVVISTDGHAGADLWDYKPYLERRWHEEFDAWATMFSDGWSSIDSESDMHKLGVSSFLSPINWDGKKRLEILENEGVVAEIIFPNTVPPFYPSAVVSAPGPRTRDEYEHRWAGVRAHNRWLVDFCSETPGRRAGIAQLFHDDVDAAVEEVRWAKNAGLKGVLLPADHLLQLANIYHPRLEPLWGVCAELGIPVHRHSIVVGEPAGPDTGLGAPALGLYEINYLMRRVLGQVVLAGILERHASLKVVFSEMHASWVLPELARLDAFCRQAATEDTVPHVFAADAIAALSKTPSEYFKSNCWIGSFLNASDIDARHAIGVHRIMWGADFPHHEGTAPFTREALRLNFASVPEGEVRQMTSINAAALYGFDLEFLQPIADRVGPTVAELAEPLRPDEYPPASMCPTFVDGPLIA